MSKRRERLSGAFYGGFVAIGKLKRKTITITKERNMSAHGRVRPTDEEFAKAAMTAFSYEELAERFGYTTLSAKQRVSALRAKGHRIPRIKIYKPTLEVQPDKPLALIGSPTSSIMVPDDSMAAYAAGVFDCFGNFSSRLNADPVRRIVVKAKIITTHRIILETIQARYGGEISQANGDNVVSAYSLTWLDEMTLHGFLNAVVSYSVRWQSQIRPVLDYLEQLAILKMQEAELIKLLDTAQG
jgi:hypothetical protein